jgi:hypothetical protein
MKKWLVGVILTAAIFIPSTLSAGSSQLPDAPKVVRINSEKHLVYGGDVNSPEDAGKVAGLVIAIFEQFTSVDFPEEVKIYELSYADYEKELAVVAARYERMPADYWLRQYMAADSYIIQAFFDEQAAMENRLVVYAYDLNYNIVIHETLHYILHHLTEEPGFANNHEILQPLEVRFTTSKYYKDWLRKTG